MKTAALIRTFAGKPEQVAGQVAAVYETASKLKDLVDQVIVLVSADTRYGDSDCGLTAAAIDERFSMPASDRSTEPAFDNFYIMNVTDGDIFCGTLNKGLAKATELGCDKALIISTGVNGYITAQNLDAIRSAHERHALVVPLALPNDGLQQSIRDGRAANTFCSWSIAELLEEGGFDLRAAKHRKAGEPDERFYTAPDGSRETLQGVEEIIPLLKLVRAYGPCIDVVLPANEAEWKLPEGEEQLARHNKKIASKFHRQSALAALVDGTLEEIESGVNQVVQA